VDTDILNYSKFTTYMYVYAKKCHQIYKSVKFKIVCDSKRILSIYQHVTGELSILLNVKTRSTNAQYFKQLFTVYDVINHQ